MTLFDIDAKIRQCLDMLYSSVDPDGVVNDVDFAELEALQAEKDSKVESIALYIKELNVEAKALKDESDNLKARSELAVKKAERLKKYLSDSLWVENAERLATAKDKTVFESTRCKLSFRKSVFVNVSNEELIPDEYKTVKTTQTVNKTAIKEAIEAGKAVEGASIVTTQNIQIK